MKNKSIPYNPELKAYARSLRKNGTLAESLLWQKIRNRALGVQFHRQVPLLEYIVAFYCREIQLVIEIDGDPHGHNYKADAKGRVLLQEQGVQFIRVSNADVKKNMLSVVLALEEAIRRSYGESVPKESPLAPRSKDRMRFSAGPTPGQIARGMQGDHSYGKKERLKSKKLIDRLFAEGKSVSNFPIKLIYLQTELPLEVPIQAGVTVPKKNFKSAVKRNRIKRLLRESYRLNKQLVFNNSKCTFAFLFLYLGKDMPDYATIDKNLRAVLHKFKKKLNHD